MKDAAYEINGQSVSAQAFYAVACDPRRNVAVEACAGAGKTWMLVSRIVRALLEGVAASEILAITFTKRAAGEMRGRLYELLRDFHHMNASELAAELEARGLPNTPDNRQKLANLYRQVLHQDRQVQVRTFHSWFGAILRGAPLAVLDQLRLAPNYELLEDDTEAKALVWRQFHATLLAADPAARRLHADYLALVQEHGRFQTQEALSNALNNRQEFEAADVGDVLALSVRHFTAQFPEFAGCADPLDRVRLDAQCWAELAQAGRLLGQATQNKYQVQGALLERAWSCGDADGALAALLTKDGEARKFNGMVEGLDHIRQMQDLALRVREAQVQHAAWRYQQRMTALTRALIAAYSAVKRQRGWVDMVDVERAATVLLGDPVLSGWVQQRLDARVSHLLIDEFQDTNPVQWQALSSWLSAYAGTGGGHAPSVFLVGDPKQSIYRFRRAEPQVFIAAQRFIRDGLHGDVLCCDHTRRNAPAVICAVNQVMGTAMQNGEYAAFRPHTTGSVEAGGLRRLPQIPPVRQTGQADDRQESAWRDSLTTAQTTAEDDLHAQEARQAAQWVADAVQRGTRPADIMVLARTRVALTPMLEALRQHGVPALLAEKTTLIETCEVQDVVALLDVLVSPQHNLSLARVLKSPILGWSDEDLIPLAVEARQRPDTTWWDVLQGESEPLARPPAWRSAALRLVQWQAWVSQLPPHDALQAIYGDCDLLERYAATVPAHLREAVMNNLQALLGVALDVGGGRFATPYGLVRRLRAGHGEARAPASPDVVRLLTIHGAKGLEADTVVMLDTAPGATRKESMAVLVDWPGESARPARVVFLASEARPPACVAGVLQREQAERSREELNALYVAMTRARHALVLSAIEPRHANAPTWWSRLLALAEEVPPTRTQVTKVAVPPPDTVGMPFQIKTLKNPITGSAHIAIQNVADESSSEVARVGQAMHRLLQWGRTDTASSAAAAREFRLPPTLRGQAQQAAQSILSGDGAWAWDATQLNWQGNEVDLHFEGALLRIDRLVQRMNADGSRTWWVLDHKSSTHPHDDAVLIAQLTRYRRAVTALLADGDDTQVRAAFLTADGRMVEPQWQTA